ncbi:MAG: hypothetical protein WB341_17655 [Terracidiphilus sp.]
MITRLLLCAVLLVCVLPQPAVPQSRANFWFLNNTGKDVHNLFVSPHSQQSWGADVLGRATLPNGMGTLIVFPPAWRGVCVEDFRLVFDDGSTQTYTSGMNVCQLHALQFNANDSDGF